MALRVRLGIRTDDEWRALPERDREDWMVWQMFIEHSLDKTAEALKNSVNEDGETRNRLTPEAAVLLTVARWGL